MDSTALKILITFLTMTPLQEVAYQLEKDLADGKISATEALDLAELTTAKAATLFPAQAPELTLASEVAAAVEKYVATKEAEKLAQPERVQRMPPTKVPPPKTA